MTSLEVNSSTVDPPPYFFSFAQVRITAKSDCQPTSLLHYTPTTIPLYSTARMSTGRSKFVNIGMNMHSGAQAGVTWGGISGLETVQNQWAITVEKTNNKGNGSENVFWRYAYNDSVFQPDRLQKWSFTRELLPRVFFGYSRLGLAPVAEAEVMVLWSEDSDAHHGRQRGFFPLRNTQGVELKKSSVFANFIYQIAVMVDLGNIRDDSSNVMVGDIGDTITWDELYEASVTNSGATHMEPEKRTAEKDSDLGPGGGALADCHIFIHRAIEGRVSVAVEELRQGGKQIWFHHSTVDVLDTRYRIISRHSAEFASLHPDDSRDCGCWT